MDFWGPFSGGAQMAFFGLRNALPGISGLRVLYGASTIATLTFEYSLPAKFPRHPRFPPFETRRKLFGEGTNFKHLSMGLS